MVSRPNSCAVGDAVSLVADPHPDTSRTQPRTMPPRRVRIAVVALCAVVAAVTVSCSDGGDASRIGGKGAGETTTTRAPLIPPDSYDAVRNAKDPNSFLSAFTSLGASAANTSPAALAAVAVGPVAMDFIALVTRVQQEDYSVAYRIRGKSVSAVPGETFLTIVHTPSRQKIEMRAGSAVGAQFVEGDTSTTCTKIAEWDCKSAPPTSRPAGAEVLLYFLGLVAQNPGAFDTETYQSDIVGVPVNCIRAEPVTAATDLGLIEVCVTAEGVPLRAVMPDLTLDGVWYKPSADPADLVPPV